ncbi:hypothetical protein MNBD_NITROSPINAE03-1319 [hydrothermal vent metagenome]|uniref:Bacterial sugar transferase domain-containing protein n=1 Tax=hydrothermal vent metagenome TaxID=652676 RepID=A0A3B1CJL7_9ZZZZ
MLIDSIIVCGLLYIMVYAKGMKFDNLHSLLAVTALLLMWISYNSFGVYRRHTDTLGSFVKLLKAWSVVVLALVFIGFATKTSTVFSRQVIVTWVILSYFAQINAHIIIQEIRQRLLLNQNEEKFGLLIGASDLGKKLAEKINHNPWLPVNIVGVVDDDESALSSWRVKGVQPMGAIEDLNDIIDENNISDVYITLPIKESHKIEGLYLDLINKNIDVQWAPDIFGMMLVNHSMKEIGGIPLLALSEAPIVGAYAFAKSLFDKIMATIALIVLSPVMIATAIAIKATSPGPVMFKQRRNGWGGEVFEVWKFRSMYVQEEEGEAFKQATQNDPRVTAVGRFIRRTSIDELPQLFNVLEGNMSLVGPRPHPVPLDDHFSKKIEAYFARHMIKPGITGLAQVNGFRGETETVEKMQGRFDYDLHYINNWSIILDLRILFKTIFMFCSSKAY